MPPLRLLPDEVAAGAWQMAADDAMLAGAAAGGAALRFYRWPAATLSLGYFQPGGPARAYPGLAGLDWVRRPTGGAALVHHHELTYALALPPGRAWQPPGVSWLVRFHEWLAAALSDVGVSAALCAREDKRGEVLCFLHHTPGDLIVAGHKVVGSAQRKWRGALLQHGGILLGQSEHTPQLPGLAELAGRPLLAEAVRAALLGRLAAAGWAAEAGEWSAAERDHLARALSQRYLSPAWNERR